MKLLILGGTVFLGRHVAHAALAAGHEVTLLTRGLTQPELFPEVEHIRANRDGGLDPLRGRRWNAIVDTCGFVPRVVAQSAALACDRYVYVSSVSVYADLSAVNAEDAATLDPVESEDVLSHYGALKRACERVLPPGAVIVRPGLIVGPHDPTGRFTYWPVRIAEGGDVLAPNPPSAPVQVIDVRDLASWLLLMAASGEAGIYNALGDPLPMADVLQTIREAVHSNARFLWADLGGKVDPWNEMPLWVGDDPAYRGKACTPNARARAAGLRLRPLADTARDTLAWARGLVAAPPRQVDGRYVPSSLTRAREAELLAGLGRRERT